ncbi:hypothetical protein CIB48_g9574 [Xylaria polymorpha]|nr:hypothetical protein CIB48_g9574 [Xylaria polymorpha]
MFAQNVTSAATKYEKGKLPERSGVATPATKARAVRRRSSRIAHVTPELGHSHVRAPTQPQVEARNNPGLGNGSSPPVTRQQKHRSRKSGSRGLPSLRTCQ